MLGCFDWAPLAYRTELSPSFWPNLGITCNLCAEDTWVPKRGWTDGEGRKVWNGDSRSILPGWLHPYATIYVDLVSLDFCKVLGLALQLFSWRQGKSQAPYRRTGKELAEELLDVFFQSPFCEFSAGGSDPFVYSNSCCFCAFKTTCHCNQRSMYVYSKNGGTYEKFSNTLE